MGCSTLNSNIDADPSFIQPFLSQNNYHVTLGLFDAAEVKTLSANVQAGIFRGSIINRDYTKGRMRIVLGNEAAKVVTISGIEDAKPFSHLLTGGCARKRLTFSFLPQLSALRID